MAAARRRAGRSPSGSPSVRRQERPLVPCPGPGHALARLRRALSPSKHTPRASPRQRWRCRRRWDHPARGASESSEHPSQFRPKKPQKRTRRPTAFVRSGGPFAPDMNHELPCPPMRPEAEGDARELKTPTDNSPEGRCASPKAVSRTAERPASSVAGRRCPTPKTHQVLRRPGAVGSDPGRAGTCLTSVRPDCHRGAEARTRTSAAAGAERLATVNPKGSPARRPSTWPRRWLHPVAEGGGSTSHLGQHQAPFRTGPPAPEGGP